MPVRIIRNDITKVCADAIVNAANSTLLGGGGVDGCIHRAAGPGLLEECRALGGCPTGEARLTGGYALPCRYVIHAVGPVWQGGGCGEARLLAACYRNSLELAKQAGCETVAFPLISAGIFGYPREQALRVAMDSIGAFLLENDMTVYLVVYGQSSVLLGEKLMGKLAEYIDDRYVEEHTSRYDASPGLRFRAEHVLPFAPAEKERAGEVGRPFAAPNACGPREQTGRIRPVGKRPTAAAGLDERLSQLDESFSQMLLRKIDERGMTDAACYKRANIDRKLFSKIRGDARYRPSKPTVLAFAVALELELPEARALLEKAGFALSHSNRFDIIVEYFIERRHYDIFEINEALFSFDQPLLGG